MPTNNKCGTSGDRPLSKKETKRKIVVDALLNDHTEWEAACKLLSTACSAATSFHLYDLPDTPEIDTLRHELYAAIQYYLACNKSAEDFELLSNSYEGVKEQFATRIEEFVMG